MNLDYKSLIIYIATHKKVTDLPKMPGYSIIQVNAGKNGRWKNCIHDDDGTDNISEKNFCYCELTALYALWKNCNSEIKGLVHYRRFLSNINKDYQFQGNDWIQLNELKNRYLSEKQIVSDLISYDVILPAESSNYPLNLNEDRMSVCCEKDLIVLRNVLQTKFPDYFETYEILLKQYDASLFNIMIAKKEVFDNYCKWVFAVLGEVEKRVDISNYDTFHKRIFGFMSELLLDVFIKKNQLKVKHYGFLLIANSKSEVRKESFKEIIKGSILVRLFCSNRFNYNSNKMQKLRLHYHGRNNKEEYCLLIQNSKRYYRSLGCIRIKWIKYESLNDLGIKIAHGLYGHSHIYSLWFSTKERNIGGEELSKALSAFVKQNQDKQFFFYRFYLDKDQYEMVKPFESTLPYNLELFLI